MKEFDVYLGEPDVVEYHDNGLDRYENGEMKGKEKSTFKKFLKAIIVLSEVGPKYPSLNSHEIEELSEKAGFKVFESYLENNTPAAGRIFWCYWPEGKNITILGIEPHPNDKKGAYKRVKLSDLPNI